MRRIFILLFVLTALFALCIPAMAITGMTDVTSNTVVTNNGSCQVSISATVVIDSATEDLTFPLPRNASHIRVNGSRRVSAKAAGDVLEIDLSKAYGGMIGSFPLNLTYDLDDCIQETELGMELHIPMLSGFGHPVQGLSFTVALPGNNSQKPAFTSGYHQSNIEKDLTFSFSGSTISGHANKNLKDHETLEMILPVTEELFPRKHIAPPSLTFCLSASGICAALAFLYWLIFLRCLPPAYMKSATAPEGCTAGELGSILSGIGADLTMMVFSWAQLGYLTIDAMGRKVILYKQMDMGNERSSFERKYFNALFRNRHSVDTGSLHYATLCRDLSQRRPSLPTYFHPKSGNPLVLRGLGAGISLFAGAALGIFMASGGVLQWFWAIIFAGLTTLSALHTQRFAEGIFLRKSQLWYQALILTGIWLLLSIIVGQFSLGLLISATQLAVSFFLYFGGRRTESGKYAMAQILGLRRYLRTIRKDELQRIIQTQPDYFHTVAPYAMASGCLKAFARRFGKQRLPACPYITLSTENPMTAAQWHSRMEDIIHQMEQRQKQLPKEKLMGLIASLRR